MACLCYSWSEELLEKILISVKGEMRRICGGEDVVPWPLVDLASQNNIDLFNSCLCKLK